MQSKSMLVVIFLVKFTLGLTNESPIGADGHIQDTKERNILQSSFYAFRGIPFGEPPIGNSQFANDHPIVTIPLGRIQGTKEQTIMQTTFFAFRGIPFAKEPIGNLRFAPPEENGPWKGILNATADKDWCPQINAGVVVGSENCLHLGVYTPNILFSCSSEEGRIHDRNVKIANKNNKEITHCPSFIYFHGLNPQEKCTYHHCIRRLFLHNTTIKYYKGNFPVMVEIYGGGFELGTSNFNSYRPDFFLAKNVVYVAINYRIGLLGFLSTGDMVCPGNNGLRDQILALKWVKKYIRYFGGDPNRVTVFGQSAGGASISYLVQSRLAKGLFNRGILQSGTSLCSGALTLDAPKRAFEIGQLLGIKTTNSSVLLENYRKVNLTDLLLAQNIFSTKFFLADLLTRGVPFGPVQEQHHSEAVFSGRSYQQLLKGDFQRIPLMIGHTSNEAGPLTQALPLFPNTLELFESDVTKFAPSNITQNITKRILVGTKVKTRFIGNNTIISQLPNFVKYLGLDAFSRPVRETVRLMCKFTEIHYYQFSYEGILGHQNTVYEGASHGEDAIYLFAFPNRVATVMDLIISDKMVTFWTNFAKTGNPTPAWSSTCSNSVLGNLVWTPNNHRTPDGTIRYLNINATLEMQTNPFQSDWLFYKNLFLLYGDPPYFTY